MSKATDNPSSPLLSAPPSYSAYFLDAAVVFFLAAGTFLVDFLDNYTLVSFRAPLIGSAILCAALKVACDLISWRRGEAQAKRDGLVLSLLVWALLLALISPFFWYEFRASNYYLGLIVAYIIYQRNFPLVMRILVVLLALNTMLQAFEFATGHYLYVVTSQDMELSEKFFSGELSVFRAKGLFQGPLTADCFAVGVAFLHRKNPWVLGLAAVSAVLANGRLGIILICVLGLLHLQRVRRTRGGGLKAIAQLKMRAVLAILGLLVAAAAGGAWIFSKNPQSLIRIMDAANLANAQNLGRVFYWQSAIEAYSRYDLVHVLVGNLGYFRHFYGNSAESDWLMLLLDTGLAGFLMYAVPAIFLLWTAMKRKGEWVVLLVLFVAMGLYTHSATPVGNVLLWLFLLAMWSELRSMAPERA